MERNHFRRNLSLILTASAGAAIFLVGCQSVPPGVERGPHGTIAYDVLIEASPPGARIEANGEMLGSAPLHLKIFGDKNGTFHDFGSPYYVIRGLPVATNQFVQTRLFRTRHHDRPEDYIPRHIDFDISRDSHITRAAGLPLPGVRPPRLFLSALLLPAVFLRLGVPVLFWPGYHRHW